MVVRGLDVKLKRHTVFIVRYVSSQSTMNQGDLHLSVYSNVTRWRILAASAGLCIARVNLDQLSFATTSTAYQAV